MSAIVTVTTELTQSQALALAQFVKRLTWSEIQACAVDENEAYEMRVPLTSCRSRWPKRVLARAEDTM